MIRRCGRAIETVEVVMPTIREEADRRAEETRATARRNERAWEERRTELADVARRARAELEERLSVLLPLLRQEIGHGFKIVVRPFTTSEEGEASLMGPSISVRVHRDVEPGYSSGDTPGVRLQIEEHGHVVQSVDLIAGGRPGEVLVFSPDSGPISLRTRGRQLGARVSNPTMVWRSEAPGCVIDAIRSSVSAALAAWLDHEERRRVRRDHYYRLAIYWTVGGGCLLVVVGALSVVMTVFWVIFMT